MSSILSVLAVSVEWMLLPAVCYMCGKRYAMLYFIFDGVTIFPQIPNIISNTISMHTSAAAGNMVTIPIPAYLNPVISVLSFIGGVLTTIVAFVPLNATLILYPIIGVTMALSVGIMLVILEVLAGVSAIFFAQYASVKRMIRKHIPIIKSWGLD